MNDVTSLHYDKALGCGALINKYQIVGWFKDTR